MKYNTLGKMDISVSALGFGASAIGGMFGKTDERESIRTIQQAFHRGINYFDTSPAYGTNNSSNGPVTSEVILGKGLKPLDRSKIVLSSKAGKIASLPPEFSFRYDSIIGSVESSLQRLQTDYLDIVFLHDIEYDKGRHLQIALDEGIGALKELKKNGKIRFFGVSCYPMEVLHKVIDTVDMDAILVHNHYTLINDLLLELLPKINSKGLGLVSASPFASGLLTSHGPPDWYPNIDSKRPCIEQAIAFCKSKKVPLEKIALHFATDHSEIPTTLFSCINEKMLNTNIDWIEVPVDRVLISELKLILEPLRNTDFDFGAYNK